MKVVFDFLFQALSKYQLLSENEADKIAQAVDIKEEMKQVSMVNEFAKYAKLQRKLNQIQLDLESTGNLVILFAYQSKDKLNMIYLKSQFMLAYRLPG